MAHCYYHALSSVRKWGGEVEDYLPLHQWFDQSKAILADPRHRALRHHAEGIFKLEALFGATLVNADGRTVPVRLIGEQHVREDLGFIPSFADWARLITPQAWMLRGHPLDGAEAMPVDRDDPAGAARSDAMRSVRRAAETVIIDVRSGSSLWRAGREHNRANTTRKMP